MSRHSCRISLIWLMWISGVSSTEACDVRDALRRGHAFVDNRRYPEAVAAYDQAVGLSPDDTKVLRCRGFSRLLTGDAVGALADFKAATRRNPKDAALFYGRASAFRMLGDTEAAIRDFRETVRRDPEYDVAIETLALLYLDLGDINKAVEYGQHNSRTHAVGFVFPEAGTNLADAARVELEKLIVFEFWILLSDLYHKKADSILSVTAGSVAETNSTYSRRRLSLSFAMARAFDKSFSELDKLLKVAPADWRAYEIRGAVHGVKGDLNSALADFSTAVALNPRDRELRRYRSKLYTELGDSRKAMKDLEEIERITGEARTQMERSMRDVFDQAEKALENKHQSR